jgi:hypothetical protein
MLLAIALMLQTQQTAASESPPSAREKRADSVATRKFLSSVRRAETQFIIEWRHEWERNKVYDPTGAKFASLHCHFDDFTEQTALHLIHYAGRKSMCPVWHEPSDTRVADEALSLDNGLSPKGANRSGKSASPSSGCSIRPRQWLRMSVGCSTNACGCTSISATSMPLAGSRPTRVATHGHIA